MKVLVCGGRYFGDAHALELLLGAIHEGAGITEIIHGGASGADMLAGRFAVRNGIPVTVFPADWKAHRKAAGPIRNSQMLREGRPDMVVAFKGGRGTADMVKKAKAAGVPVVLPAEPPRTNCPPVALADFKGSKP